MSNFVCAFHMMIAPGPKNTVFFVLFYKKGDISGDSDGVFRNFRITEFPKSGQIRPLESEGLFYFHFPFGHRWVFILNLFVNADGPELILQPQTRQVPFW